MKNKFLIKENFESQNLFEKLSRLSLNEVSNISMGFEWVITNLPNAVLVGGTAVVHYISGARDLTPDLDFMVSDIGMVKNKLSSQDIKYGDLDVGYGYSLGVVIDEFNTDILNGGVGNVKLNKMVLRDYLIANIGGVNCRVVNPELLAIMKIDIGRDKDVNDGFALLSSGKVNKEKYVTYLNELKNSLNDYESLYSYRLMIN